MLMINALIGAVCGMAGHFLLEAFNPNFDTVSYWVGMIVIGIALALIAVKDEVIR